MTEIPQVIVCRMRDLIHHFGVFHPSVSGSQIGQDLDSLGCFIPALASGKFYGDDKAEVVAIFQRHGWGGEDLTVESALDLAEALILYDHNGPAQRLEQRRRNRRQP